MGKIKIKDRGIWFQVTSVDASVARTEIGALQRAVHCMLGGVKCQKVRWYLSGYSSCKRM